MTPFFTTTLAAAANAGDTNIKVASVTAPASPGKTINIDTGAADREPRRSSRSAPRARAARASRSTAALGSAHASGVPVTPAGQKINVDTGAGRETATIGRRDGRRGRDRPDADGCARQRARERRPGRRRDDQRRGRPQRRQPGDRERSRTSAPPARPAPASTFTPALDARPLGRRRTWRTTAAPQTGHTGDIGGVPLVQPPPPGSAPGTRLRPGGRAARDQRRELVVVERLRRPLVGRDADPPEHDGDAHACRRSAPRCCRRPRSTGRGTSTSRGRRGASASAASPRRRTTSR